MGDLKKCWYCGSPEVQNGDFESGHYQAFDCMTVLKDGKLQGNRTPACYEAQIAHLEQRLMNLEKGPGPEDYEELHSLYHECIKDNVQADDLIKDLVEALDAAETILRVCPGIISNAGGNKPMMSTGEAFLMVRRALESRGRGVMGEHTPGLTENVTNLKAQATPVPWDLFNKNGFISIYKNNKEVIKWTGFDSSDYPKNALANAEFIVRACNSHESLLAALEAILNSMSAIPNKYRDQAKEALKRARGG